MTVIGGPSDLSQYQSIATLGLPMTLLSSGQAQDGVEIISQTTHITGPSTILAIRIINTDLAGNAFQPSGFSPTHQCGLYIASAPIPGPFLFTWSSSNSISLPSGAIVRISDAIFPSTFGLAVFPSNTAIKIISQDQWLGSNQQFAYNIIGNSGGFGGGQYVGTANFVNQIGSANPGINIPQCRAPLAIIGVPVTPYVSVLVDGDS